MVGLIGFSTGSRGFAGSRMPKALWWTDAWPGGFPWRCSISWDIGRKWRLEIDSSFSSRRSDGGGPGLGFA